MISAIVLTKNDEKLLKVCLQSLAWADELIVIDDESTDSSAEIAKEHTGKVHTHAMTNFTDQRNWAMQQAQYEWVLYIDSDERVTSQLKDEILKVTSQDGAAAYRLPRRNFFLGTEQKYVGGWPDYVTRLIKKDKFVAWEGDLHEQPKVDGTVEHLENPLIHLTHRDITQMTEKTLRWSKYEAKLRLDTNHPPMTSLRFFRILLTTFWDWYVMKKGYKGGTEGTIEAIFQTFSMFITYVRLWEMQQQPSLPEKYKQIDENLVESGFSHV